MEDDAQHGYLTQLPTPAMQLIRDFVAYTYSPTVAYAYEAVQAECTICLLYTSELPTKRIV